MALANEVVLALSEILKFSDLRVAMAGCADLKRPPSSETNVLQRSFTVVAGKISDDMIVTFGEDIATIIFI
tara:strand:- start:163 stop:375 length:213 start_codon:yes stop_codon:yes gene_type:complete